jgi:hypothetical protein
MGIVTRSPLAVCVALLAAGAPAAAASWSPARTLVTAERVNPLSLGMNARGDAVLVGEVGDFETASKFTALRPAGGRFGSPRRFEHPPFDPGVVPILDSNRGGTLIGPYLDPAPELHADIHDTCCYRLIEGLLTRGGGVRSGRKVTPHGEGTYDVRVDTDDRGGAAVVWRDDEGYAFATRRPRARFSPRRRLRGIPAYASVAARPSGWAFAEWIGEDGRTIHAAHRRGRGSFTRPETIFRASRGIRVLQLGRLVVGRNGHVWATWDASPTYSDADRRVMAAPRRSDGSYGRAMTVASRRSVYSTSMAVDDGGNLHVGWSVFPRGSFARSVSRTRGPGAAVRLSTRSTSGIAIDGGPGGRAVVAWQTRSALYAAERRGGGRFGRPHRLDGTGSPLVAMSRRGETLVVWSRTLDRGTAIRYAALRP